MAFSISRCLLAAHDLHDGDFRVVELVAAVVLVAEYDDRAQGAAERLSLVGERSGSDCVRDGQSYRRGNKNRREFLCAALSPLRPLIDRDAHAIAHVRDHVVGIRLSADYYEVVRVGLSGSRESWRRRAFADLEPSGQRRVSSARSSRKESNFSAASRRAAPWFCSRARPDLAPPADPEHQRTE